MATTKHPADGLFYVDYKMLTRRDMRACDSQLDRFNRVFKSKKVVITSKNVAIALRAGLHLRWLLRRLPDQFKWGNGNFNKSQYPSYDRFQDTSLFLYDFDQTIQLFMNVIADYATWKKNHG